MTQPFEEYNDDNKYDVLEYCLLRCIKDNYIQKPEDDIQHKVAQALLNSLGKKQVKTLYSVWACQYYGDRLTITNGFIDTLGRQPKKFQREDHDYILQLAKVYDEDDMLTEIETKVQRQNREADEKNEEKQKKQAMRDAEQEEFMQKYEIIKKAFEQTHFKCGDMFYQVYDNSLRGFTKYSFSVKYEDLRIDDEAFLDTWYKDHEKRQYEHVDFLPPPLEVPPKTFNTWDIAMKHPQYVPDLHWKSTALIHEFLRKLTNSGEEGYEFILKYLAHLVKHPSKKPEVGIFFTSSQGSGKDTFAKLLTMLLGESFIAFENDPDNIFGKFNLRTRLNKLVVILQEADNLKSYTSKIKDLITCRTANLQEKCIKSISVNDYSRLMVFSNRDNILNIEPDDRRWVIFKCWNYHVSPDPDFFTELHRCIEDPDVIALFHNELMEYDVEEHYNFQKNRPLTEIYEDLKEANTPAVIRWAYSLCSPDIVLDEDEPQQPQLYTTTQLTELFNEWCRENFANNNAVNPKSFGLSLKKYFHINQRWNGFNKEETKSHKYGARYYIDKTALRSVIEDTYKYQDDV